MNGGTEQSDHLEREAHAEHGKPGIASKPTLYVVATPIGNLGDIGARAIETLRAVDAVAAEDTRVTRKLLDHYGISTRVMAAHAHNEPRAAQSVLELLGAGKSVALVTDAGTPAISDPGALVVARVRQAGFTVSPLPGASAAAAAVSASGFASPQFLFYGFLPARSAARRTELDALAKLPYTLVFYEAPHRIAECVEDLAQSLGGERGILIARELTKLFEETHVCALSEASAWLAADGHRGKGEFVLVVEARKEAVVDAETEIASTLQILLAELPLKQAVALTVKLTGTKKNAVYEMALDMTREGDQKMDRK